MNKSHTKNKRKKTHKKNRKKEETKLTEKQEQNTRAAQFLFRPMNNELNQE